MDNVLKEITSKRIKELRLENRYTMEKLSELIGVSKSTIAKWENGYVDNMRQDNILKLAQVFGVSPTYIMGYDEIHIINEDERTNRFKYFYEQLTDDQKTIIDNLLTNLVSKQ